MFISICWKIIFVLTFTKLETFNDFLFYLDFNISTLVNRTYLARVGNFFKWRFLIIGKLLFFSLTQIRTFGSKIFWPVLTSLVLSHNCLCKIIYPVLCFVFIYVCLILHLSYPLFVVSYIPSLLVSCFFTMSGTGKLRKIMFKLKRKKRNKREFKIISWDQDIKTLYCTV